MSEPNSADLLQAAVNLQDSMGALGNDIQDLRDYGKHNRHMIIVLAVSLGFSVLLSAFLVVVAVQANHASAKAAAATSEARINRQAQVTSCLAGNQARQVSAQLWTYVLDRIAANPDSTPESKRQVTQFRAYVKRAYALRDCSPAALTHSSPPPR